MIDYFDTRVLTGVINKRPPQYSLFADLFFTPAAPQLTDKFELHIESRGNNLLPFVSNVAPGRVVDGADTQAVMAIAPRIRVKRPFHAVDVLKQTAGYTAYDLSGDPVERTIVKDLDALRRDVDTTIEWMCSQIATQGKIVVNDYENGVAKKVYEIDNRMPAAHKLAMSTADTKWTGAKSRILENVEDWAVMIQEETGNAPTDIVLGKNAYSAFLRHADVKDTLDMRRLDGGDMVLRAGNKYKGMWNGLRVWLYTASVTGHNGQPAWLLDPDSIVLGAKDPGNVIEYGLPLDRKCAGATAFFAKTYEQEDPSMTWLLVESRPMPWAKRPGCFVCAKVV